MQRPAVAVLGASGYVGLELTGLLAAHPQLDLRVVTSDRWQGDTVGARTGCGGPVGRLTYAPLERSQELTRDCEVVFLATPAEVSHRLVPQLVRAGRTVVDLSGAFRLKDPGLYPLHYGFNHQAPALLERAVYGLPELFGERLRGAELIANPGCYATAAALALAPLLKVGLIDPLNLIVDAASGVTGAGRKATEDLSFGEVSEDFRAYRVLRHQHTPEIAATLADFGASGTGLTPDLTFTAHLLPLRRGILATCYARLRSPADVDAPRSVLGDTYARKPFVRVLPNVEAVSLRHTSHTNRCDLSVARDARGQVIVVTALDNLLKGAAGQALQNLNLALGFEETLGLSSQQGSWA